jgi:hypothetical protein
MSCKKLAFVRFSTFIIRFFQTSDLHFFPLANFLPLNHITFLYPIHFDRPSAASTLITGEDLGSGVGVRIARIQMSLAKLGLRIGLK